MYARIASPTFVSCAGSCRIINVRFVEKKSDFNTELTFFKQLNDWLKPAFRKDNMQQILVKKTVKKDIKCPPDKISRCADMTLPCGEQCLFWAISYR